MPRATSSPASPPATFTRRRFLRDATAAAAGFSLLLPAVRRATAATGRWRAAIIGHTGRGDYGHGLDVLFAGREDVEVVAVADPVAAGRAKAAVRAGAARQYPDYQEMLRVEKPDLVSVAPRQTDQHHEMALAALRAGGHVFLEKPITRTLAEGDELLAVARQTGRRIAVAHQMRMAPSIVFLKQRIEAGLIGDLLEIRAHGKQDHRAGGEDLIVLGTHLFDLMRLFAGDPEWCFARVLDQGRPITPASARAATENIGPVAGDEIFAQFAFPTGVNANFTSRARARKSWGHWGMELIGSRGAVRILADISPRIYQRSGGEWTQAGSTSHWGNVADDPSPNETDDEPSVARANQRLVADWLDAIGNGREAACSGDNALRALEMAHAVFVAGLDKARVNFPLANRNHPLPDVK